MPPIVQPINLILLIVAGGKHERVVGGGGSEPHIARHALIGVYDRVYLNATLLLTSCPKKCVLLPMVTLACFATAKRPKGLTPMIVPALFIITSFSVCKSFQ